MTFVTLESILIGQPVTTSCWMTPSSLGDCPPDMWPLTHDIIIEEV